MSEIPFILQLVNNVKDRTLEITDVLNVDASHSYIMLTLQIVGSEKPGDVLCYPILAVDMKLVCHDILTGNFSEWKAECNKNGLKTIVIRKDPKYRSPWVIKIDRRFIEPLIMDTLTVMLFDWDARKMAQTVLDYIRDWGIIHFRKRQIAQEIHTEGKP